MRRTRDVTGFSVAVLLLTWHVGLARIEGASDMPYVERIEKSFTMKGSPQLTVSTLRSSVEIRGWDRPQVNVVIEKRAHNKSAAAALEWHAEQHDNLVSVDVRRPIRADSSYDWRRLFNWHELGWNEVVEGRVVVFLPFSAAVDVQTGSGSIDIASVSGKISLETASGALNGRQLAGALRLRARGGSISVTGVKGTVSAETIRGDIVVNGALTGVDMHSRRGAVKIRAASGSSTDDGWEIGTVVGPIVLEYSPEFGARLQVNARQGRVDYFPAGAGSKASGQTGGASIPDRIGSGGGVLRLSTLKGTVTVRQL